MFIIYDKLMLRFDLVYESFFYIKRVSLDIRVFFCRIEGFFIVYYLG